MEIVIYSVGITLGVFLVGSFLGELIVSLID